MSREVEVTNISMVATTPEDIQISLGLLGTGTTASTNGDVSLAANTGVLIAKDGASNASNGQVAAPKNVWDWADTADFSHYYQVGKLMPASSNDGTHIFFTPDANGVGKTVKDSAEYFQADTTVNDSSGTNMRATAFDRTGQSGTGSAKATLHAWTGASDTWASTVGSGTSYETSGTGGYKKSKAWNDTQDDGYYVDIPVWLRTSSSETTTLTVKGYVAPRSYDKKANANDEALYKAVRVAILAPVAAEQGSGAVMSNATTGLLRIADGMSGTMTSGSQGELNANPFAGTSILDWYHGLNNSGAVFKSGTGLINGNGEDVYKAATEYDYNAGFVTLTPGTGGKYGEATKIIVRVWLEGNDPDCWNDTAGQDWYINLKFGRKDDMDGKDIIGARVNDGDNLTNTSGTGTWGDGKSYGNTTQH